MGLRTRQETLPDWLLQAARNVAKKLEPSKYSELYRLASNARQAIMLSSKEWREYDALLVNEGIEHTDRNHATALMLALMPKALKQEKEAREAAIRESRARMARAGVSVAWGHSGNFAVSEESSGALNQSAERLASALDRLAKK